MSSPLHCGFSSCVAGDDTPLSELLTHSRDAGIAAVEIGYERSAPALADRARRQQLLEESRGHGGFLRSLHAPYTPDQDLSKLDEAQRQTAVANNLAALQLTVDLDIGIMVLHASQDPIVEGTRPQRIASSLNSLQQLQEEARNLSLQLAVETMPPEWIPASLDEVAEFADALDPAVVGFCFDVNHSNLNADPVAYIDRFGSRIIAVHISDNDGVKQRRWIPGEGIVDWAAFAAALRRNDVHVPLMYEVEPDTELAESVPALRANFEDHFA